MSDSPIRVFVVDDHALFRDGVRALLLAQDDMQWVGEAADGAAAADAIAQLRPDVVLMDISMPEVSGIEATHRALALYPAARIIMVTMLEDDASLLAALRAGAVGYVLKGSNADELLHVIRAAAQGRVLFSGQPAQRLLEFLHATATSAAAPPAHTLFPDLTKRERELLEMIAAGLSNSEIADRLVISPKTVRNHITSIFAKLGVGDRAQAIVKARQAGLERQVLK